MGYVTAPSFLYYEIVKKCDIGRGDGQNLGIWRYVTFEQPLTLVSRRGTSYPSSTVFEMKKQCRITQVSGYTCSTVLI